ncbi:hypothetical protein BASA81_000296 [Batrachochytrium salamandrivorans]|nr:hypothetical protein BASA81_000296 [Batrachochytrium salamandrivorans]
MIPSRTVVQIRTHAQKYFQKQLKDGGHIPRAANMSYDEGKIKRSYGTAATSSGRKKREVPVPSLSSSHSNFAYQLPPMPPPSLDHYRHSAPSASSSSSASASSLAPPNADFFSGATPRTVAAATILLVPSRGGNHPPWLEKNLVTQMRYLDQISSRPNQQQYGEDNTTMFDPQLLHHQQQHAWPTMSDDMSGGGGSAHDLDAWTLHHPEMSPPLPITSASTVAASSRTYPGGVGLSTTPTLPHVSNHHDEVLDVLRTPPPLPD